LDIHGDQDVVATRRGKIPYVIDSAANDPISAAGPDFTPCCIGAVDIEAKVK